ncbi:GFA family protein [bacterium]|nr:GFA family protein [bacterium]
MTEFSLPFGGHCLCGAVRYECDAQPLWQGHCHCESCRRATSSGFTSYFGVADGHWRWTEVIPLTYNSSPGVWRDFCGVCGSPMAYRAARYPGETHFFAASLNDPAIFTPARHYHARERLPWVHLTDDLSR